ncbi:hypothetical protein VB776_16430 [Arcicella sp. DC2W]|uniref:Outer membrane protein beta-barrel domain-containing protein n=1 Tax=Arcicella gelida TaxID=2984195 RepID=A0ABU5S7Y0_9BACT|nr:hypothetical protein [Arcicella sp. DC2W]MEA5404520.1 hypothetical protein [Arcicella sp. DC2W]
MKKIAFICSLVLLSFSGFSQYKTWAVGAKLGDPSGLTIRHYLNNDKNALELNVGVYGALWGLRSPYRDGNFDGAGISFSGIYLWHQQLGNSPLRCYYGFGGQITSRSYILDSKQTPNTGIGGIGQAGLEYGVPDSPLSVFGELGLYIELVPAFFYTHPQGGLGVRYNF